MHKMAVMTEHSHQLATIEWTVEIEQNETLVRETIERVEVDEVDDDDMIETVEIDDIDIDEARLTIIQWTDDNDEIDETDEFDEDDEIDEVELLDMQVDLDEVDETDTSVEIDEITRLDVIVWRGEIEHLDENESFNDDNDEKATKQCEWNDDNDETQSIICIDSDYMLAKYSTMWFVENDESDEIDDVIICRVHTHLDDEIDDVEPIDEKSSFDISEILFNDVLMWADENDDVDEALLEVATDDVLELTELLDVVWFAKLCNFIQ